MYGTPRANYVTRLLASADPGSDRVYLEPNLDWVAGDLIGFAPTNMMFNESDHAIIASYDSVTGVAMLDRDLTGYHYGTSLSTEGDFDGVDLRGEVFLMNRNIRIEGEDVEAWGC
mmetsp:Transcript_29266/g.28411  ORF Transcript_29266/g.28411 Transcript_29266/m.28411 type:complete len:115 (-) Transcript_29266:1926-2270(-)